jgi:hypothetical protein
MAEPSEANSHQRSLARHFWCAEITCGIVRSIKMRFDGARVFALADDLIDAPDKTVVTHDASSSRRMICSAEHRSVHPA